MRAVLLWEGVTVNLDTTDFWMHVSFMTFSDDKVQ